ncbi:MAG: MBG domain-containing protein, partial [Rhodoferax sp.]|uniref:MBG domain-containing protein n=1 Tax=Rhodoferax sp. TaxID=50421 RepID=UPI002625D3A7
DALGWASVSSTATSTTAAGLTAPLPPSAQAFTSGSAGNYVISYANGTLSITQRPITVTASDQSRAYGDANPATGAVSLSSGTLANTDALGWASVSSSASSTTAAGLTAPLAPSAQVFTSGSAGNYAISYANGTLSITKVPLTVSANAAGKTYDGLAYSGGNGVAYSGLVNGETSSVLGGTLAYGGSSQGAVDAGSYIITPGGQTSGNYTVSYVNGALTIGKAPLTVSANAASKTYDGLAYSGGNGVAYSGFVNGETSSVLGGTLAYGGSSQGAVNAGSYIITPGGQTSGNYTISYVDGALTIRAAPPRPPAPVPAPLPTPQASPQLLSQASAGVPGSGSISVSLVSEATIQTPGMVAVAIPKEMASVGSGFTFPLPAQVFADASPNTPIQVSLLNGSPLPAWLRFVPETNSFVATAVPDGAFPIQVVVTVGTKRTTVVISERAE